jgi:hypothetical protein
MAGNVTFHRTSSFHRDFHSELMGEERKSSVEDGLNLPAKTAISGFNFPVTPELDD